MNGMLVLTGGALVRTEVDVMDTGRDEDGVAKTVVEDSGDGVVEPA